MCENCVYTQYCKISKKEAVENAVKPTCNEYINTATITMLLTTAIKTINTLAQDTGNIESCHYCLHLPAGGDGKCCMYADGSCNFKWRYADMVEQCIKQLSQLR